MEHKLELSLFEHVHPAPNNKQPVSSFLWTAMERKLEPSSLARVHTTSNNEKSPAKTTQGDCAPKLARSSRRTVFNQMPRPSQLRWTTGKRRLFDCKQRESGSHRIFTVRGGDIKQEKRLDGLGNLSLTLGCAPGLRTARSQRSTASRPRSANGGRNATIAPITSCTGGRYRVPCLPARLKSFLLIQATSLCQSSSVCITSRRRSQ